MRSVCTNIQKFNHQTFSILDLKGTSDILKAQIYLKKTIEINIGEYPEWIFIKDCQKIRNSIVHDNCYFEKEIGSEEDNDFEKLLKKLGSFRVNTFAQDMTFKKLIKTYSIINCDLNFELIEKVSGLFQRLYDHIIIFNSMGYTDQRV